MIAGVSALAAVLVDAAVEDLVLARRSASLRVGERLGIEGGADRAAAPLTPVPRPLATLLTAFDIPILCLRGCLLPDRLPGKERL